MQYMCGICATKGGCTNNDAYSKYACVLSMMLNGILSSLDIKYCGSMSDD